MRNYKRLFKYVLHYKFLLIVIVFSTIMSALLNVTNIALLKPVLEVFFGEVKETSAAEGATSSQMTQCPYGEPHLVYLVKEPERIPDKKPGVAYTYCPFGKPHPVVEVAKKPSYEEKPAVEEKLKSSLRDVALFKPFFKLYDKSKVWKKELQLTFYQYIKKGKKFLLLAILGGVILVIEIFKFIFVFLSQYFSNYVGLNVVQKLRTELYDHILGMDMAFFHRRSTGELMSRIGGDVGGVRNMLMLLFSDTLQSPLNMLFIIALMLYLNWQLTLLLFIFGPLTIIPVRYFGKRTKDLTRKAREKFADISASMQEIISNIIVVKAFNMESYVSRRFKKQTLKELKYLLRRRRVRVISSPFMDILGTTAVVVTMLVGGYFIAEAQTMSSSSFFVYLFAMSRLYKPIKKLNKAYGDLQKGLAYSDRIFEILDTKASIVDKPNAITIPRLREEIRIEGLWFAYYDEVWALKDINLVIPAGKMLALVGPSGAGKSTLVSLLLRFYDPQKGGIYFDGIDIREARIKSLREQIGIVLQENILFNDTIRNNITCGNKNIPMERVIEAAKQANAHEFIEKLPDGYDTIVGERGSKLSGGQRQRIAIARAILQDPAILVLDEATSSLDSESESKIQEAIVRLVKDRTTIVIAHRLSTVMNADKIVVLDKGSIVEQGKHHELLERKGFYARLCAVQFKSLEASV